MNSADEVATQYKTPVNLDARITLHERFSVSKVEWLDWVFGQIDLPQTVRLLAVGCAPGVLCRHHLPHLPAGWQVVLTDQSAGMLAQSRANVGQSVQFAFEQCDVQSLPFADAEFDGVIANHMLYHVPDLSRGLAEIHRVLKPGGRLFAATNGNGHMVQLHELVHRFDPQYRATPFRLGFALENGSALLALYFAAVELRRYESSLRVTERAPLVAYARSMDMVPPGAEAAFEALVAEELRTHGGVIEINKETGLFRAVKAGEG